VVAAGHRVVAVGSTSTRTLEWIAREKGRVVADEGIARLYLRPGDRFHVIDALITNFHLPGSTPLILVAAFAGRPHQQPDGDGRADQERQQRAAIEVEGRQRAGRVQALGAEIAAVHFAVDAGAAATLLRRGVRAGVALHACRYSKPASPRLPGEAGLRTCVLLSGGATGARRRRRLPPASSSRSPPRPWRCPPSRAPGPIRPGLSPP